MGDNPEMQETTAPQQPGKLLTAEEILRTPDEESAQEATPGRGTKVFNLDALIAASAGRDAAQNAELAALTANKLRNMGDDAVAQHITAIRAMRPTMNVVEAALQAMQMTPVANLMAEAGGIGIWAGEKVSQFKLQMDKQFTKGIIGQVMTDMTQSPLLETARLMSVDIGRMMTDMTQSPLLETARLMSVSSSMERRFWGDMQTLGRMTDALIEKQAGAMQSIRNVLIPLDTLRLSLQMPTWMRWARDWAGAIRRALIGELGGNPDDPCWVSITTEQLAQWVEMTQAMEQSTGLTIVMLQPAEQSGRGRPITDHWRVAAQLVDRQGMSKPQALQTVIQNGILKPQRDETEAMLLKRFESWLLYHRK